MPYHEQVIALGGLFIGLLIFILLFVIAFYIYTSWAWMTIARKLKYDKPWLAWIPIANSFLRPILAGKHWAWGFILLSPLVVSLVAFFFFAPSILVLGMLNTLLLISLVIVLAIMVIGSIIVALVFTIMWTWKIYEKRDYPGWLSLIRIGMVIPYIGFLAVIAELVVMGLVAWKDQ